MDDLEEGDNCPKCTGNLIWQSHHQDSCCSCHKNPPCSYCTDQDLVCKKCGEIAVEYTPSVYKPELNSNKISLVRHRNATERYNDLPDGVFGYVKFPSPRGWGMDIMGKLPKDKKMNRAEILSACGICEYGCPSFKQWSDTSFYINYNYD